jgi:CBS domain containing-hemolysin-like protein
MILLFTFLFLALAISFLCSIMESVLFSVTPSYVAALEKKSPKLGSDLRKLKQDIDKPLAAILSLNTLANTMGAAGVGAQALIVFGKPFVAVVSAILTLLILIFSEIIPKTLGALYWRQLTAFTVSLLKFLIFLLFPLVILTQKITQVLSKERKIEFFNREEIRAIADVGYKEGLILKKESIILKNLMRFGSLMAKDIMTPRPVMFSLSADLTLEDVLQKYPQFRFSRIPIYYKTPEDISHFVLMNDVFVSISKNERDKKLGDLQREILIVPETVSLFKLFDQLLDRREYIALVVDEYGGIAGIATLEDIIETLIGIEITDETDVTEDMQKLARNQWIKRAKKLGLISDADELEEWLKK